MTTLLEKVRVAKEDKPVSFERLNLQRIEELVGRPPENVTLEGNMVVCHYSAGGASMRIHFKKW